MTTIQLGRMGNSTPGGMPQIRTPAGAFGAGTAQAIGEAGRVAGGVALDVLTQERQRDEQERAQAERLKAYQAGNEGELDLRRLAEDLGERIVTGAIDPKEADEEWSRGSRDVMSERTRELAPQTRDQVGSALRVQAQSLTDGLLRKARRERTRAEIKTGLMQSLELAERNALDDRPRALAHVETILGEMGGSAGLGPDDQFRMLQGFRERTATNHGRNLLRLAGDNPDHLTDLMTRVQGDEFADLTPESRDRLETQITNRQAKLEHAREVARIRAQAASERRSRDAEDATKALQTLIDGGSLPADEFLATVQARTAGTPFAESVKALVAQGRDRAGFASLPPDRQQAALLQARAQASAQGSNPATEKRISQLQAIASQSAEKAEREPLRWGADTRLLDQVQPLQFGSIEQLVSHLGARVDQASTVAAALKRPVSPLLSVEAQSAAEALRILPPQQQRNAVQLLAQNLPPDQIRAVAKQMGDRDQALALAMFASAQPNPPGVDLPGLILQGADAERSGRIKKDDAVAKADARNIAQEMAKVPWPTPQARDAASQAAELVYKGLQDQKKGGGASWREAVRIATGELADHAGQKVPVPPGWTERRFLTALRNTDAVSLAGQMLGPVFVNGQEVRPEDLAKALPVATLIPVGPGKYAIDAGGMVLTAQRKPWVFTLRD